MSLDLKLNSGGKIISVVDRNAIWDSLESNDFLTRDQILADLHVEISREDKDYIKAIVFSDLIQLHHSFGQWIRNTYGLWHPNNPMTDNNGNGHPDDISFAIIEDFYRDLTNPHAAYNAAMSII